jgi:hypothetical protein
MTTKPVPLVPWLDDDKVTRLYLTVALFLVASFVLFMPAWLMDTRVLDNAAPWTKPQKFNISLGLHFATLAVLAQLLPRTVRTGWVMLIAAYAAGASLIFEYIYMAVQSARGVRSHYNFETQSEALAYALMGLGAVLMIFAALVLAVQIWRKGDRSRPGLWLGSIIGLATGFFFVLVMAGYMSSAGRYVGASLEGGGATVPFFGWSREYGDLRPSHFVAMHLMQIVPLAGWLADRQGWNYRLIVWGTAFATCVLAIALFIQALAGQPFWPV